MDHRLGIYRRLFGYLRPYWPQVVTGYAAVILATVLNLFIPQIIKWAIDQGLAGRNRSDLILSGLLILALGIVMAVAGFGQRYFGEWLTHRVAFDLRNKYFDSVQRLSFAFHNKTQTGDLMSRATSDIAETERFIGMGLMDLTATILLLVGVIIAMFLEEPRLAAIALIPIPILVGSTIRFGGTIRPMFKSIQEQLAVLSSTMQESLTGIQVVKSFAREPYELQKFDRDNDRWFTRRYKVIRKWANNWPFFSFTLSISIFLLLWFGGPLVLAGTITVGSLFAMTSYVLILNGPVQRLGFLVNLAATAGASAGRVFEIVDTVSDVSDPPNAIEPHTVIGEVVFKDVSFAYHPGINIVNEVTFSAAPGQTIALMGPTGSGKSTVTNLIPRFYDVTGGAIFVDGIDVREWALSTLRRHIGIVLQDTFLFSVTISENIAYGRPDASAEEIVAVAKAAKAHEFIMSFPEGYETMVGERGVTLSGGQKQRIAIARALLIDPKILILDDSTSSVDTETEHLIQQALETLMAGRTTFIIAQRLLTLKKADEILVVNRGVIVERGSHDELLTLDGLYRQIYDVQLRDQDEFAELQDRLEIS